MMLREDEGDRCQRLWQAVLVQALLDAVALPPPPRRGMARWSEWNLRRAMTIRAEARRWLAGAEMPLVDVCALAGIDPDQYRARALEMMRESDSDEEAGPATVDGAIAPSRRTVRACLRALRELGDARNGPRGQAENAGHPGRNGLVLH